MTTGYNKTDGLSHTTRKPTGHNSQSLLSLRLPYPPTYTVTHCQHNFYKHHTDGSKHNIRKGMMDSYCMLLPDNIVCKITQKDIRRANTCDQALKLLNEEITSDIHKQNIWKEHLDAHWDHRHNTYTYTVYSTEHLQPH